MKNTLTLLSKGLSIILYPMLSSTYSTVLICFLYSGKITFLYGLTIVGITFFLTFLCPFVCTLFLISRGKVQDVYIYNASERTIPYIVTAICGLIWCIFIMKFMPTFFSLAAWGGLIAFVGVILINRKWKISVHLMGMGCILGTLIDFCICYGQPLHLLLAIILLFSFALMGARLYLNAHTSLQVTLGFLLGLICPVIIYALYLLLLR